MTEKHTVVFENESVRVERIESFGFVSKDGDWFDQDGDELAFVTVGSAIIGFEDGQTALKTGEHIFLPAHKKHRIAQTSPDCVWLCVHIKPN